VATELWVYTWKGTSVMDKESKKDESIEVSGIRFNAKQVKSAVVTINDRDVHIGEIKNETFGFGKK